jgi:Transposase DDE domain
MKNQYFTRERKQPFGAVLLFMFNLLRKSLAVEIDNFVTHLNEKINLKKFKSFTQSAFVQNRKKIKPAVFQHLSEVIIDNFYTPENENIKGFMGFRILAVDGSTIALPDTEQLREKYGETKNQTDVGIVKAKASVLYDIMNHLILDASLGALFGDERDMALLHKKKWRKNDLIIYDRGYPSYDFVNEHIKNKIDCLIRVKVNHSGLVEAFVKSGETSEIIDMIPGKNQPLKAKEYNKHTILKVRLVRVELPSGEVEVLMTTLLDEVKFENKIFKELYFMRWGIETFYDELKNKLKVEYFTGYSENSIQQDFHCAIFISNIQSIIVNDLQEELAEQNKGKKYVYKINTNVSYGFLKNRVLELLFKDAPLLNVFEEIEVLFLKHTVPIRKNRNNPRNIGQYRRKLKPKVTKNQKDAV